MKSREQVEERLETLVNKRQSEMAKDDYTYTTGLVKALQWVLDDS
jgi:hypothetical protein